MKIYNTINIPEPEDWSSKIRQLKYYTNTHQETINDQTYLIIQSKMNYE